ncbi:unnamed protein product [Chrysodeixis includens]|uniref:Uncharacterized protein n=1 Tax=Chrysodeixis includens TaxID=689277 RepID=A0A9N8Q097_CHRIL|nr:unnamed protein product [Chrysodeixis includens]
MKLGFFLLLSITVAENKKVANKQSEPIDELDIELDQLPSLAELLPTLSQKTSADMENIPEAIVKSVSIDIDKINLEKFKKKMDVIMDQLAIQEEPKNDTRRQAQMHGSHGQHVYEDGTRKLIKRKILDCMLQTVYMARHKLRNIEGNTYFDAKDPGFRIAFTYRRIGRAYHKLHRLYSYAVYYEKGWTYIDPHIVMHAKATRLHVDFHYFWWVLVKVDNRYKQKMEKLQGKKQTKTTTKKRP